MRSTILVAAFAIIYASASFDESVVPEDSLFALNDDLSEARSTVDQMTSAGKSDKDCRKLVTETRKDITTNVDSCQKVMNALPAGSQCVGLGQTGVKAATEAKSKADKHHKETTTEVTKASSASVDFGSRTYSSLTQGKCESFYSSSAYTTAKTRYTTAVTAQTKAKGAAEEAAKAVTAAIAAAKKEVSECLCKTKKDHNEAFATHTKADAANQKAWNFACKVECVLDGKTACKCSAAPKCKRAKVTSAVMEESCPSVELAQWGRWARRRRHRHHRHQPCPKVKALKGAKCFKLKNGCTRCQCRKMKCRSNCILRKVSGGCPRCMCRMDGNRPPRRPFKTRRL